METTASQLSSWTNFYVMIGSSSAALTGLMFVVITLVQGEERVSRSPDGISTFSTPTVMHFSVVLLIAAIMCAPWRQFLYPAIFVGAIGVGEVVYLVRVARQARNLKEYEPDAEDWAWYTILPFAAYAAIIGSATGLYFKPVPALFVLAGGEVLLVFIGIRNAWDVVTFLAVRGMDAASSSTRK